MPAIATKEGTIMHNNLARVPYWKVCIVIALLFLAGFGLGTILARIADAAGL